MSEVLLRLDRVSVSHGHVEAVTEVSLSVSRGETLALLGPNGAGKTTLLGAVSGRLPVTKGKVFLGEQDITGRKPNRIAHAGVLHVPEGRQVVAPLTVQENLELAALASKRCPKHKLREGIEQVFALFPRLQERRNVASGLLSGGEQQMLAMGRALIARPEVLLLDEPSMGLAPVMVEAVYEFLGKRKDILGNIGIILAEQSRIALSVSDTAAVLSRGKVVFTGSADTVTHDLTVQAYLGTQPEEEALETSNG